MITLIAKSNTFDEVFNLTEPYFKGNVVVKTFAVDNLPNHFGTKEWNLITKKVVEQILSIMKDMKLGDLLMYVDSDILMFDDAEWFKGQLKDSDFIFQYETGFGPNFGFFVVRVSPETIALLEKTYNLTNEGTNSQVAFLNAMADTKLKISYFDTKDVWNVAVQNGGAVWNPGDHIDWPPTMKAFHANFTIGKENKIKLLTEAIKRYVK
jgi:hypothetical protein